MGEMIYMPKNGLTMREGVITKIHTQLGAAVEKGTLVMEYETDKISGEILSETSGVVLELLAEVGNSYKVLSPLGFIGQEGETISPPIGESLAIPPTDSSPYPVPVLDLKQTVLASNRIFASPYAKKLAKDNGIDINLVEGHGENGYIQKQDILAVIAGGKSKATSLAKKTAHEHDICLQDIKGNGPHGRIQQQDVLMQLPGYSTQPPLLPHSGARREKMTSMRKTIAARLSQSKQSIPHVYFKNDFDASELIHIQKMLKQPSLDKYGHKITINNLLMMGTARALSEYAIFNAQVDGDEIVYFDQVNLGFAVSVDNGLMVPVIKNASFLSLSQIMLQAFTLAEKARSGKLMPEEFSEGTFTISNLGGYGINEFSAIINPPESGILAVGKIADRPAVQDGQLVIKPMATITLSVDHRIIDGTTAASFLNRLTNILENASSLLL